MLQKTLKKKRNRTVLFTLALALSSPLSLAQAQELGSYRVINVKPGSALNVRAEHSSKSEDIGSASFGSELQVVDFSPSGGWAKIVWDGDFGWVSVRFLSPEGSDAAKVAALAALQRTQAQAQPSEQLQAQNTTKTAPTSGVTTSTPTVADIQALEMLDPAPNSAALRDVVGNNPSISCSGNGQSWSLSLDKAGALVFQAPDSNSLYANTQWRQASNNKNTYAFAVADIKGTLQRQQCLNRNNDQNQEWQLELQTNGFGGLDQLSGCCTSQ